MKRQFLPTLLLSLLLFSWSGAHAVSTGQVVGQVIEKETHKPVAFAEIIFENRYDKIIISANEYGFFYGNHLPTGKYQIRVQYNNRSFVMNDVRVYDSYATEVNLLVSNNAELPAMVTLERSEPVISSVNSTGIRLANNSFNQPTQSLSDVLGNQPGVDVRNGKIYIKGSDQVRFFIDGTPVIGQPTVQREW